MGWTFTKDCGLGHPRPQRKTFNHLRRSHGRNGSKSSFSVYEEESPQKHQCHVHRSESVSSRKTPQNHKSQCPLHGRLQKPERHIADHGLGASNVSPKDDILFGSLYSSHCSTPRLFSHRYETRDTDILRLRSHIFPGEEQKAYADIQLYTPVYPRLIQFYDRCGSSNMVSQRLKKHANELVYLQKARPCIRKHLITKADRSLVDCLCECADNIKRKRPVN